MVIVRLDVVSFSVEDDDGGTADRVIICAALKHAVVAEGDGNIRLFGFFDDNFGIRDFRSSSSMSGSVATTKPCPPHHLFSVLVLGALSDSFVSPILSSF